MLRNAFDAIATEGTLRNILRAITFARTPSDQLRVVVDSGGITVSNQPTVTVAAANNGSFDMAGAGVQINPWTRNSWNMVDARYQYGEIEVGNFQAGPRQRWTFS